MKEEVYSMFREYLTPEKGYRLLTIKGRENKTIIAMKAKDGRRIYKSLKGTIYDCSPEAVKRLESIGNKSIEKIRDSVEMDNNGVSLFDSMEIIDNVAMLLRAITASNKYDFDDLVDYCDTNIYLNYVIEYIGVKNKDFNKKLSDWYWSDDYYKVMIERSPYDSKKEYKTDFVKVYGVSRGSSSNSYEVYGIINSDFEFAALAGTKVSDSFELAPNTYVKLLGFSSDWRNTANEHNVLQYNTYLSSNANTQLRKLCFTTSAIFRVKLVRNKNISLRDIISAYNNVKSYNDGKNVYDSVENYRKDKNILTQFNQALSDSKFGVKYTIVDSLAFLRQYDDDFEIITVEDEKFGISGKLLVNYKYSCGYILSGTKFNRKRITRGRSGSFNYPLRAYKVFYNEFSDDSGYVTKDSGLLSFIEINAILYGMDADAFSENNIFDNKSIRIDTKKKVKNKIEASTEVSETRDLEDITKELEEKTNELNKLKRKVESIERYVEDYRKKSSETILELEKSLKTAASLNSSLMASMLNFRNDIRVILDEFKAIKK